MKYLSLLLFIGLLPMTIFSQTSYTWTGSSDTDWGTSNNWSPSGVPSTGDAVSIASSTNQPILDMARSIGSLSMSASSTLNLSGYVLTVSGTGTFTSGTVSNGELITGSFNASSSTFSCDVTASGNSITTTSSNYQGEVSLNYTGSANVNSGGNTFEGVCHITQSGTGLFVFGQTNPDVFEDSLFAISNSNRLLIFSTTSTGNRFEGYTLLQRGSSATSSGIKIGNSSSSSTIFLSQVELSSISTTGTLLTNTIEFSSCTFDTSATLAIHSSGFSLGQIEFLGDTVLAPVNLSLSGSSSFLIDEETTFHDSLSLSASSIFINDCNLSSWSKFTKTGSGVDQCLGPITANALVHFKNTGTGYFYIEGDNGDSYSDVILENTASGNLAFCRRGAGNTMTGNLATIISNGTISIGINAANRLSLTGDISINSTGGSLIFGGLNQQSGGSLSYTNLSGGITFSHFNQLSTSSIDLTSTGSSNRISLGAGSSFSGKFKAEFPSILVNGGTFADSLTLVKTGNITDQGSGNLTCYGPVKLTSSHSSGNWQINYAGAACVYHDNVTYQRNGAGNLDFGYVGPHQFKKDLHITGTHAFGQTNNHFTFNGAGNQTISRGHSLSTTFVRLAVDKPSGDLIVDLPLSLSVNLNLQKGIVKPTAGNNFVGSLGTSITGGSDSSYVEGPMLRYGTSAFTYPVGGGGVYAPVTLEAVASNCTFKVEYIAEDPDSLYSRTAKDTSIGFINRCGYWNIDRTFGSQNTTPTLGWNNNPCYSTAPVDASVAFWDGSAWKDKGNAAYSGTSTAGNVKSAASITSYPTVVNLGGVCNLQASLTANRDTLIEGYMATITASPANQSNYKFYVNDSLFHEGQNNSFKTHILQQGDSVSVEIMSIDSCFGSDYLNIITVAPTAFSYNTNFSSSPDIFAKDEVVIDSTYMLAVAGDLITSQVDTSQIAFDTGILINDTSIINSYNSDISQLINTCKNEGGVILTHTDSVPKLNAGLYRILESDSLNEIIILNSMSSDVFIYKEGNLNWTNDHQLGRAFGDTSSRIHILSMDTIFINGVLPERFSIYANTISINKEILMKGDVNALGKLLINKNTLVDAANIVAVCATSTDDECQILLNGSFTNIRNGYLLQGDTYSDLAWLDTPQSGGTATLFERQLAIFQATQPLRAGSVCNWLETQPNGDNIFALINPFLTNSNTSHEVLVHPMMGIRSNPFINAIASNSWAKISFKYRKPSSYLVFDLYNPAFPAVISNTQSTGQLFPVFSEDIIDFNDNYTFDTQEFQYMPQPSLIGNEVVIINSSELNNITNNTHNTFEAYVMAPLGHSLNYLSLVHALPQGADIGSYQARISIDDIKVETCCVSPFIIESTNESNDYIKCSEILDYVEDNDYLNEIFSQSSGGPLVLDVSDSDLPFPPQVIFGKTLWVDIDFEINNSTVMMLDGLNINVRDGNKLTIDNSSIVGCQVKWGSIFVERNAELIVRNNSTIEDAKAAIWANGSAFSYIDAATITFTNSKILDCNQGIIINGAVSSTGNYPLTFHSSEITTSPGGHLHNSRLEYDQNLSNPGSVLPPSRGIRGLDIRYSGARVSIGTGWGSQSQIKISKLEQGVRVLSANFKSINTHIEDIYSASSSFSNNSSINLQTSAAVLLDAIPGLPSRTVDLSSGIGQINGGNSIENCSNGVIGKVGGYSSVSVRFSTINLVNEAISFSKYIKCIFTIDVNNITYASRYGVRFNSNSKCQLTIKNNEISNTNGTANANAGGVGIHISNPLFNSNTTALVTNNKIKNYLVGIYASNLNGGSFTQYFAPEGQNTPMGNYFADNEVTLKPYLYNPFYDFTTGYYFNNCGRSYFYHNEQNTFNTSIINNSAGFYFSGCVRANIICNSSEYTTYSNLFTLGDQHLTFAGNLMQNGNHGVYLLGSTIGWQGVDILLGTKVSHLNSWDPFDNPISGGFTSHLFADNVNGTNSEFFLKCITCSTGVGEATSPYPFISNSNLITIPEIPFTNSQYVYSLFRNDNSTCWEHGLSVGPLTIATPDEGAGDSPFMKRYKAIQVADTSNSYDAQRIYDATFELYSDLMYDEGYLENDTLEDFVDSLETENIGKFYLIDQELSNKIIADTTLDLSKETSKLDDRITDIENLRSISDSITASGVFEQAHHQVLKLLLDEESKYLANLDSMYTYLNTSTNIDSLLHIIDTDSILRVAWTSAEKDSIETLAERCAFTNGKSVINARAIWSTFDTLAVNIIACEIPNPSSSRISGVQISEEMEEVSLISIYPNPAKGSLTISTPNNEEVMLVEFIDVSGRIVKSINLNPSNMQVVDVSSISAGWYAVSVTRLILGRFVKPIFIEN